MAVIGWRSGRWIFSVLVNNTYFLPPVGLIIPVGVGISMCGILAISLAMPQLFTNSKNGTVPTKAGI